MNEHDPWMIGEVPFSSQARYIGPLIVRFRQIWNGMSTRWYVLPMIQQLNVLLGRIRGRFADVADWIARVDRDQTSLRRELAETRLQIARLEERLRELESRADVGREDGD
ncbi:MAG: hypothetical protein GX620_11030 [Chloroflexi bacterium]|nr:hypothetical protein [Chloroflexota bacterium]